ncbi:MAG: aminopeptidase N [Candidatus Kinetoplastibacterium crithidii]|nr:MAG: aminopeptidase N [Candidatus Kinetoplastibacterium crithidii]
MLPIKKIKKPITINRFDYKEFPFFFKKVDLQINLDENCTIVTNTMEIQRKIKFQDDFLYLNADFNELVLIDVILNNKKLNNNNYIIQKDFLLIKKFPDTGILTIVTKCFPSKNLTMMGLYLSNKNFITQCEPEGFRKITCFPDRPDVMSKYLVTLIADAKYSTLLSNGNLISTKILANGKKENIWEDPFPKPSYLFALVVGEFSCLEKKIKTIDGKIATLQIYSDPKFQNQTEWAMYSLIKAIRWDEYRYNLKLDLDQYMIVAVNDFNMGAMENKGLNIFNSSYILADENTATDSDYENIITVIGHEYFHNWTGNRVTCRDWFQLSLKEGLTVFREQEFFSDVISDLVTDAETKLTVKAVKRIDDTINLRSNQFPEDSSPMAHPIRPDNYQEISNFYTSTIYEKGAEIIRMLNNVLGDENFLKGINKYFSLYDGKAITCDDFLDVMQPIYYEMSFNSINDRDCDFNIFKNWYKQAGTPIVSVSIKYDQNKNICIVTLTQECDFVGIENNNQFFLKEKKPFYIPFAIGFLDYNGNSIDLVVETDNKDYYHAKDTIILELYKKTQIWTFKYIENQPIPSLLRNFSAPVKVNYSYSNNELYILANHDKDYFARWEALQELSIRQILENVSNKSSVLEINEEYFETLKKIILNKNLDNSYCAKLLTIPNESTLFNHVKIIDPILITNTRWALIKKIGSELSDCFLSKFEQLKNAELVTSEIYNPSLANNRLLRNLILKYLIAGGNNYIEDKIENYFYSSKNMTDSIAMLWKLLNFGDKNKANKAKLYFYNKWKNNNLVIDKWFAIQSSSRYTGLKEIKCLMEHPDFVPQNPNRVRSLVFQFCFKNYLHMHKHDGSGYRYWAEQVISLDRINPEVAARLARALDNWHCFVPELKSQMHDAIEIVYKNNNLSRNTFEIVSKALNIF